MLLQGGCTQNDNTPGGGEQMRKRDMEEQQRRGRGMEQKEVRKREWKEGRLKEAKGTGEGGRE